MGGFAPLALAKKKKRNPEKQKPARKNKKTSLKKVIPASDTSLTA